MYVIAGVQDRYWGGDWEGQDQQEGEECPRFGDRKNGTFGRSVEEGGETQDHAPEK